MQTTIYPNLLYSLYCQPIITLIMQNEPNFRKSQMNVNKVLTKDYENKTLSEHGKNEPKTNPIKANTKPINANKIPKQTQYKPNTNPIRTQSNPISSKAVSSPWTGSNHLIIGQAQARTGFLPQSTSNSCIAKRCFCHRIQQESINIRTVHGCV